MDSPLDNKEIETGYLDRMPGDQNLNSSFKASSTESLLSGSPSNTTASGGYFLSRFLSYNPQSGQCMTDEERYQANKQYLHRVEEDAFRIMREEDGMFRRASVSDILPSTSLPSSPVLLTPSITSATIEKNSKAAMQQGYKSWFVKPKKSVLKKEINFIAPMST